MIDELQKAIKEKLKRTHDFVLSSMIEKQLIALLVLKYLCDKKECSYSELIKKGIIPEWTYEIDSNTITVNDVEASLLSMIQYEDLKELVLAYINQRGIGIAILDTTEKKLCFGSKFDRESYDLLGNTTYVLSQNVTTSYGIFKFKFYDLVLGNKNQYLHGNEVDYNQYQDVYFLDAFYYRFIRKNQNSAFDITHEILDKNSQLKIVLHTHYREVASINYAKYMLKYIAKIVLFDNDNVFIYLDNENKDKISIVDFSKAKDRSLEKLWSILRRNRQQKDVLIKVDTNEIKKNNYRIGFKLYQTEFPSDTRSINEIVDQNTSLINRLTSINEDIELEINKLMNR